jgi:phosphate transporter
MYAPWSENYIAYDRLKRLIDRKLFLKKKMEAKKQKFESSQAEVRAKERDKDIESAVTELTPLRRGSGELGSFGSNGSSPFQEEDSDSRSFMFEVDREVERINKFFEEQVMELRVQLHEVVAKWEEQHASHHTTSLLSSHLVEFRHIFQRLTALEEYGPLNRTGFYKIIKKYDKNMNEKNVKTYMQHVDEQNFVASQEPKRMIEVIAGFVSRSKLVEWKHAYQQDEGGNEKALFPSVRPHALAISLVIFIISFQLPPVAPGNPNANRCLSLLLLVVSLWLTNAMPYFATAMLVPVMIPLLGVMRVAGTSSQGVAVGGDMSAEMAAKFVLNSFFNHTTVMN